MGSIVAEFWVGVCCGSVNVCIWRAVLLQPLPLLPAWLPDRLSLHPLLLCFASQVIDDEASAAALRHFLDGQQYKSSSELPACFLR